MENLFGIPMNSIMLVLLALLGLSLSVVGYVVLRNRVMFLIGLRNIPRRMAQTTLIVIGLMLSTLIISAAFTTGDTVNASISSQTLTLLGHLDEVVLLRSQGGEGADLSSGGFISEATAEELEAALVDDPNIDGVLPILFEVVPVINSGTGLSSPEANIVGLDAEKLAAFPDFLSLSGDAVDIAALAEDEVYVNKSLADEAGIQPGDLIQVFVQNQPLAFGVADVVENRLLTGVFDFENFDGLVTHLATVQRILEREGEIDVIGISNNGDVRSGIELSDVVVASVETVIEEKELDLEIEPFKKDNVEGAEEAGNFMATFFLLFGLFSIAAGILLILMIFVMLAAERKSELGMTRAIGTKRGQLIQAFLSEGMAYNLAAAAVGAALGVLVSFGITHVMARIFSEFNLNIQPQVTLRSVVISYSLGVVLTFITVTFSSWRVSKLNIVAAIRDITEPKAANPEEGTWRGYLRGVLNAVVVLYAFVAAGVLLLFLLGGAIPLVFVLASAVGLIGPWLYLLQGHNFSLPANQRTGKERIPKWPLLVLPMAPFYLLAVFLVRFARDRRPRNVPNWLIIAGILVAPLGLVLVALQDRDRPIVWSAGFGTVGVVVGALLMQSGMASDISFLFALGFSLILSGVAIVLRFFRLPSRPVFTAMGLLLLLLWGFVAGNRLEFLFGPLEGGMEMFFLSGISMVTASTFVLIYNADIILTLISRIGSRFGRILPAMKTAVAYPLANKFRTGMTMAMISLIVFALVMMSTMNLNFDRLFLNDEARGGWDVLVEENANNPLGADLVQAITAAGFEATGQFRSIGRLSLADRFTFPEIREHPDDDFEFYSVRGVSPGFVDGSDITLEARATDFDSDEAVWQQIRNGEDVALIDAFVLGGFGPNFGPSFLLDGISEGEDVFDPVALEVRDPASGNSREVKIIGVISLGSSASFFGVFLPEQTFTAVFGQAASSQYFIGLDDPDNAVRVADGIESALTQSGTQASSIKKDIDDDQALFRNFFRLMQSFMGLGLFVGIAAVGVISFRSVVERRQQIGMLRAIGYTRGTVALSFILESTFVAALGVLSGVGLAIWLSYFLITSDEFPTSGSAYSIPWIQVALISAFAFFASLLMTIVPARQAASVPIAEALRYE